jgi:hypothetical protein
VVADVGALTENMTEPGPLALPSQTANGNSTRYWKKVSPTVRRPSGPGSATGLTLG